MPLNQVVGDNDAPIGPPSVTITTKQAVQRIGPAEKRAYGDHERLPEEATNEGLSLVELAQAQAKALVEDMHNEALENAADEGMDSVDLEPTSEGALSTEGSAVVGERETAGSRSPSTSEPLRGQALDDALNAKGLSTGWHRRREATAPG